MKWLIVILSVFCLVSCQNNQNTTGVYNDDELVEEGDSFDYFGQKVPSDQPIVFAEGVVSGMVFSPYPVSFSSDHQMMIFGGMYDDGKRELLISRRVEEGWTDPEAISFTDGDEMEPVFSSDSKRIYFASNADSIGQKPGNIYYVDVLEDGFSEPVKLPEEINTLGTEYYASQSLDGTLYFTREGVGLYQSNMNEGEFQTSEKLNFDARYYYASHPYVSKDGSYLLFDARHPDNIGSADLFIAFETEDGYSEPINLGDKINSTDWDAMAMLSPDEKYLFFVREGIDSRDVYWVAFDPNSYK